jgi:hypothetical protein
MTEVDDEVSGDAFEFVSAGEFELEPDATSACATLWTAVAVLAATPESVEPEPPPPQAASRTEAHAQVSAASEKRWKVVCANVVPLSESCFLRILKCKCFVRALRTRNGSGK